MKSILCKMIMNVFRCSLILCLFSRYATAQTYDWTLADFRGSQAFNIAEAEGKVFLAVSNSALGYFDQNTSYQLFVYELDFGMGIDLMKRVTIPSPENYTTYALSYVSETKRWIAVQAAWLSTTTESYRIVLYDENFGYITSEKVETPGHPILCHIDTYNGHTYILGNIIGPPENELIFVDYVHSKQDSLMPIRVTQSQPNAMFWLTSVRTDHRTGNLLAFCYDGIAVLEPDNLYMTSLYPRSQIRTGFHGDVLGLNEDYYSHGSMRLTPQTDNRLLVFQKYDSVFQIQKTDTLGWHDRDNYPFVARSLDQRNGEFLVGGHFDGPFNGTVDLYLRNKKFYLAKYDRDLNLLWYNEYGGDRPYWFWGLHLLEDGGALAYGIMTDSLDGYRYGYIMHVNSDGDIVSTQTLPPGPQPRIRVVNPGDDVLRILNPEGIAAQIILFDLHGRIVLKAIAGTGITELNAAHLPAGLYPYALTGASGKVIGSGKWLRI